MPNLLEGLLQGYMTGKEQQRQSLLDQLGQQRYAEELNLRKQALKMDEQQFKFQQSEAQRKAVEQKTQQEFEDTQRFFGEQGFSVGRTTPSLIDQLTGAGGGTDIYGTPDTPFGVGAQSMGTQESNYTIAPKPGFREKQEADIAYTKSQTAENLRQARQPAGGKPSDFVTKLSIWQSDPSNKGKPLWEGVKAVADLTDNPKTEDVKYFTDQAEAVLKAAFPDPTMRNVVTYAESKPEIMKTWTAAQKKAYENYKMLLELGLQKVNEGDKNSFRIYNRETDTIE